MSEHRETQPGDVVRCIREYKSIRSPDQDFGVLGQTYVVRKYLRDQDYLTLIDLDWSCDDALTPGLPLLVNACRFERVPKGNHHVTPNHRRTNTWFLVNGRRVKPFDGAHPPEQEVDWFPDQGWSRGYAHYHDAAGRVFFGTIEWFEENVEEIPVTRVTDRHRANTLNKD